MHSIVPVAVASAADRGATQLLYWHFGVFSATQLVLICWVHGTGAIFGARRFATQLELPVRNRSSHGAYEGMRRLLTAFFALLMLLVPAATVPHRHRSRSSKRRKKSKLSTSPAPARNITGRVAVTLRTADFPFR